MVVFCFLKLNVVKDSVNVIAKKILLFNERNHDYDMGHSTRLGHDL